MAQLVYMTKAIALLIALTGTSFASPAKPSTADAIPHGEYWYCGMGGCTRDDDDAICSLGCEQYSRIALFTAWSVLQEESTFEGWSSIADCKKRRALVLRKFKEDYKLVSQCKIVGATKRPPYPVGKLNKAEAPRVGDWWCMTTGSGFGTCQDSQAGCVYTTETLRRDGASECEWTTSVWGFTYKDGKEWDNWVSPTPESCALMRDAKFDRGAKEISACTNFAVKK